MIKKINCLKLTTIGLLFLGTSCSNPSFQSFGTTGHRDNSSETSAQGSGDGDSEGNTGAATETLSEDAVSKQVNVNVRTAAQASIGESGTTAETSSDTDQELDTVASLPDADFDGTISSLENESLQPNLSSSKKTGLKEDQESVPFILDKKVFKHEGLGCAHQFPGLGQDKLMITGNKSSVIMNSDAVMVIKLAGNQSKLDLVIDSENKEDKLTGICLILVGNEASAHVTVNIPVGKIVYIGHGNMSSGNILVAKDASVDEIVSTLTGNSPSLTVSGEGTFSCNSVKMAGSDPKLACP